MTIQRIGVVGAGTMGNGIAQVFTQAGFDVRLIDAAPTALERARGSIEKSLGKFVEKGKLTRRGARRGAGAALPRHLHRRPRRCRLRRRSHLRGRSKRSAGCSPRLDQIDAAARHPVVEHLVDLHHAARRRDDASGQGAGHALHEPGAADDAGGADPRTGHVGRVDARGDRAVHAPGQDGGRSGRLSRLHRQPHPDADDQRGGLRVDGRRRHARRRSTRS